MSCKHCHDLCLVQTIRQEQDLEFALVTIRDGMADGTLHELFELGSGRRPRTTFDHILEHGLGRDLVELPFVCSFCGERFLLTARAHPKLEGEWAPVRAESRRLRR